MEGVECSQPCLLDQLFSLSQHDRSYFHQLPIAPIFLEPGPDREDIALRELASRPATAQCRQDFTRSHG